MLKENYQRIKENVKSVTKECSRSEQDVTLIAVSKTKPVEDIQEVYEAGCRDFGENKAQELAAKYDVLPKDIRLHMIGHLQRNKVKYIIDKVCLIHSVDSLSLAEEISRLAVIKSIEVNILIEVNIGNEESKFGIKIEEAEDLVRKIAVLPGIKIQGFMCVAPIVDTPEECRKFFHLMYQLSVDIKNKNIDNVNVNVLSMGMSHDYEVAIQEGASYVRVGTSIFGERNYAVASK